MSLERFCRKPLASVTANDSVSDAARVMRERHVGAVVVVDPLEHVVGILTDRDIACRVVAESQDPRATPVGAVMSARPTTLRSSATVDEASTTMRERGVRRLPLVDRSGAFVGLVSLDDLTVLLSAEMGQLVGAVRDNRGP